MENGVSVMLRRFVLLCLLFCIGQAQAEDGFYAKLVSLDVPDYMIAGEEYTVNLTFKNAGTGAWTSSDGITLGWATPELGDAWGSLVVGDLFSVPVSPGDSIDISFTIVAPSVAKSFDLAWRLVDANGRPFGETALKERVQVTTATNQARMVMQLVPDDVKPNTDFTVLFQVKNIGRTTWDTGQDYYLALLSEGPWSGARLNLPKGIHVTPGEIAAFKGAFKAPVTVGQYEFRWQMKQGEQLFGEVSPAFTVHVGRAVPQAAPFDAEFIYQKVDELMLAGDFYKMMVQFKNTSKHLWHRDEVKLTSPNGKGLVWAIDEVAMQEEKVAPGGFASFHFTLQAPFDPGVYSIQWQLLHVGDGLFGEPTPRRLVKVK